MHNLPENQPPSKPLRGLSLNELVAHAKAQALAGMSLTQPSAAPSPGQGHAFAQEAPQGSPLAVELITERDLRKLVDKLARSPSDYKKSMGRALEKALNGEVWAPKGHRDDMAHKIAGDCVEEYPNLDPACAVQCFSAAISNAQSLGSKMTAAIWASKFVRHQNERQMRLNMVAQVAPLLSATGKALEAQAKIVTPQGPPPESGTFTASTHPSAHPSAHPIDTLATVWRTLVILADGTYYLRRPGETHYPWRLTSQQALQVELAAQFGVDNQTVITHDHKGKGLPVTDWLIIYGSNAHKIVYDYRSEHTEWDAASATLSVGLPADLPKPRPDLAVHAWLEALAGPDANEAAINDLYDWIASSTRQHIGHPAAALALIGPPDAGKGVLTRAIAATWGVLPVKLSNNVERFNGALLHSPVWHADESTPDGLTDEKFRELTQERERLIEPKGREKVLLKGCGRMIFTVNEPEAIKIGAATGADAFKAMVDRLAVFDFRARTAEIEAAMVSLMLPNGDMDLERIVGHLRWVQTQYTPRPQRFLGARADRSEAEALVLQGSIDADSVGAFEAIVEYLRNPSSWETDYHAGRRTFDGGNRYPLVTQGGSLWVHPQELVAKIVAGREPQASRVLRALKGLRFGGGEGSQLSFGGRAERLKRRYWQLDVGSLLQAVGAELDDDVKGTLGVDTRTRKPDPVEPNEPQK